jgi:translation initiation factor 5B
MAPKKKGNKRQEEDWEAELGETAAAPTDAPAEEQAQDGGENAEEEAGGGGLMAALRKNKARKAKKGKPVNDFVEGEDAGADDLASKQPEEGTFDEDDVFAGKPKKPIKEVAPAPAPAADEGDFRVKSKKEKEKEKKEREKQRKKEQVWFSISLSCVFVALEIAQVN